MGFAKRRARDGNGIPHCGLRSPLWQHANIRGTMSQDSNTYYMRPRGTQMRKFGIYVDNRAVGRESPSSSRLCWRQQRWRRAGAGEEEQRNSFLCAFSAVVEYDKPEKEDIEALLGTHTQHVLVWTGIPPVTRLGIPPGSASCAASAVHVAEVRPVPLHMGHKAKVQHATCSCYRNYAQLSAALMRPTAYASCPKCNAELFTRFDAPILRLRVR